MGIGAEGKNMGNSGWMSPIEGGYQEANRGRPYGSDEDDKEGFTIHGGSSDRSCKPG
jgi:hypothetical protein